MSTLAARSPTRAAPPRPSARRAQSRAESNVATDVRGSIPLTDQTDPRKFEGYEYQEYPKMMLAPDGGPYVDEANLEVLVYDEDEEREFRTDNPDAKPTVRINTALNAAEREELERLRQKSGMGRPDPEAVPPANKLGVVAGHVPAKSGKPPLKGKGGHRLPDPLTSDDE